MKKIFQILILVLVSICFTISIEAQTKKKKAIRVGHCNQWDQINGEYCKGVFVIDRGIFRKKLTLHDFFVHNYKVVPTNNFQWPARPIVVINTPNPLTKWAPSWHYGPGYFQDEYGHQGSSNPDGPIQKNLSKKPNK